MPKFVDADPRPEFPELAVDPAPADGAFVEAKTDGVTGTGVDAIGLVPEFVDADPRPAFPELAVDPEPADGTFVEAEVDGVSNDEPEREPEGFEDVEADIAGVGALGAEALALVADPGKPETELELIPRDNHIDDVVAVPLAPKSVEVWEGL